MPSHLLSSFRLSASFVVRFVSLLENAGESALNRTARHPRLGTPPMRLIDVAILSRQKHDDSSFGQDYENYFTHKQVIPISLSRMPVTPFPRNSCLRSDRVPAILGS